jgi:glutathione S-transferase
MRAFGHGQVQPMSAADALGIAREATPAPLRPSTRFDEDPQLGAAVRIRADDYGRDAIEGELAFIDRDEIAIRRHDRQVGDVVIHFPRLGYDLRAA